MSSACKFYLVGTPLNEESKLDTSTIQTLEQCSFILAEQKKVFEKQSKRSGLSLEGKEIYYLDNRSDLKEIESLLQSKSDISIALVSDTGMPVLFDPGQEIVKIAKRLKFEIRTTPHATSWATAACVSGFSPPFFLEGFLPQDKDKRKARLDVIKRIPGHKILMDTPYRYLALISELKECFGDKANVFLAWEIACETEFYFWGTLLELEKTSTSRGMKKGEFVLIVFS